LATGLALAAVVVVLVVQIIGVGDFNDNVNGFTLGLLLLAIVLGFALVAPAAVKTVLDRVATFKFGGVEIGLQAAERLDLLQTPLAGDDDQLNPRDNVGPSEERPRGGGPTREYLAVQEKLQERLEFVRDVILVFDKKLSHVQVVEKIFCKKLIGHLELRVLYDLLGRAEEGVERLPDANLDQYLDRAWRFSTRFGTLIFERDARKKLVEEGWFLLEFEQGRDHRPDFLAYKQLEGQGEEPSDGDWLVLATRVVPTENKSTITRLQKQRPPFGARCVVVVPDKREDKIEKVEGAQAVDGKRAMRFEATGERAAWMVSLGALLEHPDPQIL
jgi:hypothetical protein